MQTTERDVGALTTVVIGDPIGAIGIGDVDLDHDQVGLIVQVKRLDMFVLERDVEGGIEIRRQRREAERWKQRVLDGAPVGAGGFGERGKDQFDASRPPEQVVHAASILKEL